MLRIQTPWQQDSFSPPPPKKTLKKTQRGNHRPTGTADEYIRLFFNLKYEVGFEFKYFICFNFCL